MQLRFNRPHLSIERFNPVELPDLVVLTGVNGSGKSHLLEAINLRFATIVGHEQSKIVLFNYENFRLDNEPVFNAHQISAERETAWNLHQQQIKANAHQWRAQAGAEYEPLKQQCETEKRSFWSLAGARVQGYSKAFSDFFGNPNLKDNHQAQSIASLAKKIPYSIDEIEKDDFVRLYKPFIFKNDFLPNQLGKIFWDYYVKYRNNQVNEFENEKYGRNYKVLTEEQFLQEHGRKPWELVNEILQTFDT